MHCIGDFFDAINSFAPFSSAADWDNAGLLTGSAKTKVRAALLALDATDAVLAEAKELGANLIISHHPLIFPSLRRIDGDSVLHRLIAGNIGLISAHTNFDAAVGGVNDALCELLELQTVRVLESVEMPAIGRIGELYRPVTAHEFAQFVKEKLNAGCVKYTDCESISTLAVCGGSGGELWRDAQSAGAQALLTAEAKHHLLIEARHAGFALLDAGHYATEVIAMRAMASQLSQRLPGAVIFISKAQADPAVYCL